MVQRTFVLIKPDAIKRNLTDKIILKYKKAGLTVIKRRQLIPTKKIVESHYPEDEEYMQSIGRKTVAAGQKVKSTLDQGRKVLSWLRKFITSSPVVALVLEGENAIALARDVTGFTDPQTAKKGTIRGDLGEDSILKANFEGRPVYNLVHASGSEEEAEKEIKLWFG